MENIEIINKNGKQFIKVEQLYQVEMKDTDDKGKLAVLTIDGIRLYGVGDTEELALKRLRGLVCGHIALREE